MGRLGLMERRMNQSECLHCQIGELVDAYMKEHEPVDVAEVAAMMADSLADLILSAVPVEDQSTIIAHALASFGDRFIQGKQSEGGPTLAH
jgi:hypothetical protein